MNLQDEYNQAPDPSQQQQDPSQGAQDLTIPAAAVAQIMQAVQQQDCQTVCKIMAQLLSGGGQGGDTDNDGQ